MAKKAAPPPALIAGDLVPEKVIAELTGFGTSFLRSDRIGARRIPFYRMGVGRAASVRYSVREVTAVVASWRVGPREDAAAEPTT